MRTDTLIYGIVFAILPFLGCCGDGTDREDLSAKEPLFTGMFHDVLDNLMENFWVGNGNWRGDAQGDDVAFSPWLFYSMGEDQGIPQFTSMATQTVNYEVAQLEKFFSGRMWNPVKIMKAILGGPALIDGYRFVQNPLYLEWADKGLGFATGVAVIFPQLLTPFVLDPVVVVGVAADLDFDLYGVTLDPRYLQWGLAAMDVAEKRFWNEHAGYYGDRLWDWPEATMLMALAAAYRLIGSPVYRQRAEALIHTTDRELWDSIDLGYYGHDPVIEHSKALSGNNIFARAMLDWYEVTGDSFYWERTIDILAFVEKVLYHDRIIWHHWTATEGCAKEFCTGCNLMTLGNIYRLNRLRETPIVKNSCASWPR